MALINKWKYIVYLLKNSNATLNGLITWYESVDVIFNFSMYSGNIISFGKP